MGKATRQGNGGGSRLLSTARAEEALGPVDFAVGSEKSRAAARMLAERSGSGRGGGPERLQSTLSLKDAWHDPDQPYAVEVEMAGKGRVRRTVYAPAWMGAEDVRQFLYGDE